MGQRYQGATFEIQGGQRVWSLSVPLAPLDADSAKCWVQLIPGEGSFKGHPDGPFEFTTATVDALIANFEQRTTPLKFDYEHDTHKYDVLGPKPASGHVLRLERREGDEGAQLWAFVEWTARAAQMIRDREYCFNSPVIHPDFPNPASGEGQGPTLLSVALTDIPFLDGQQPIQLDLLGGARARGASKLTGGADMQPEDKPVEMQATDEEPKEMMTDDEPKELQETAEVDGNALLDIYAEKTGLDRAAVYAMLIDKLDAFAADINKDADTDGTTSEMRAMSIKEDRVLLLQVQSQTAEIRRLTGEIAALKKHDAERAAREEADRRKDIERTVDALMQEGRVLDDMREDAIHLFMIDPDRAARVYSRQVVPVASQAGTETPVNPKTVKLEDLPEPVRNQAIALQQAGCNGKNLQLNIARAIELRGN